MLSASLPVDEAERLDELHELLACQCPDEELFDALVQLAASVCGTPVSLVSLVDEQRQWFKARFGFALEEAPREVAFCAHAILTDDLLLVPDALRDERFVDNPLVVDDPHIRFYAGVPLRTARGHSLGTLCVIDHQPRHLTEDQHNALRALGRAATSALEARRNARRLAASAEQIEAERQAQICQFDRLFDDVGTGRALIGLDGRLLRSNRALRALLGQTNGDAATRRVFDLAHPEERADMVVNFGRLISGTVPSLQSERQFERADGTQVTVSLSSSLVTDRSGSPVCVLTEVRDESERRAAEARRVFETLHDPLTALPNRTSLLARLEAALGEDGSGRVGLVLVDIDRFHLVNTSLGHHTGDRALTAIAGRLRALAGPDDVVSRLGEDSFALLRPLARDATELQPLIRAVRDAFDDPFVVDGHRLVLTASMGVAASPCVEGCDGITLLRDADAALYQARARGGAGIEVFDYRVREQILERVEVEAALRRALELDQLKVDYQPEIDLVSGRLIGAEALVRWVRPDTGIVLPGVFLPVAAEAGLMKEIGDRVLADAVDRAASWSAHDPASEFAVWVNLSPAEVADPGLAGRIASHLDRAGLEPRRLGLEVTEYLFVEDTPDVRRNLAELHDLGVGLALDDFGTGYSSLSYLQRLPFGVIKIDRSFVGGLGDDPVSDSLVSAIVALAHALGLLVVAEGVETESQLQRVRLLGCERAQGFLLGRPGPPQEVEALLHG